MTTTLPEIASLFDRYGWQYQQPDNHTLLIPFRGENNDFLLTARLEEEWLTFTVVHYLPPIPAERQLEIYRYILKLNARILFVKFVLESDSDDRIILMANLQVIQKPVYDLFAMAVDTISFYANDAYPHLYSLITGEVPPKPVRSEVEK